MKGFEPWENINAVPNDMPHHDVHYRKKGNFWPFENQLPLAAIQHEQ